MTVMILVQSFFLFILGSIFFLIGVLTGKDAWHYATSVCSLLISFLIMVANCTYGKRMILHRGDYDEVQVDFLIITFITIFLVEIVAGTGAGLGEAWIAGLTIIVVGGVVARCLHSIIIQDIKWPAIVIILLCAIYLFFTPTLHNISANRLPIFIAQTVVFITGVLFIHKIGFEVVTRSREQEGKALDALPWFFILGFGGIMAGGIGIIQGALQYQYSEITLIASLIFFVPIGFLAYILHKLPQPEKELEIRPKGPSFGPVPVAVPGKPFSRVVMTRELEQRGSRHTPGFGMSKEFMERKLRGELPWQPEAAHRSKKPKHKFN